MLIQFAVTLTVLLAFCGLAIDVGLFALKKVQLQTAADAAAIGAVYQAGNSQAAITAAGQADAALNGFTDGANGTTVTLTHPPLTGPYANNQQAILATVSQVAQPFFLPGTTTLTAQATALASFNVCAYFLSLATSADSLNVHNQTISAAQPGCGIYFGRDYVLQSGSTSTGYQFLVANTPSSSQGSVSPTPYFNFPTATDPLSYVPAPTVGACTYTSEQLYDTANFPSGHAPVHISPGVYCGGLSIQNSGGVQVVLDPGVFVIAGPLVIQGNGVGVNISGSGVTFYMTQLPGYPYGQALISNFYSQLSAPTTGNLQGVLYFSDRSLPSGMVTLTISHSNPFCKLDGIMYLENQQFVATNAYLAGNQYFGIVADNMQGNNFSLSLSSNYSSLAAGNPFRPAGGGLVQ